MVPAEPDCSSGDETLQAAVEHWASAVEGIVWSVCIRAVGGDLVAGLGEKTQLPTASVGKILLLAEIARQIELDPTISEHRLSKTGVEPVGEAGLWQHMSTSDLTVTDLVGLVASLSDNLATNVLLDYVGISTVQSLADRLGLTETALLDRVRAHRAPHHPQHLSVGSAGELATFMTLVQVGRLISPDVSTHLRSWLAGNADLSMVLMPLGLDPLAHRVPDGDWGAYNKTGSDPGTRVDVGTVSFSGTSLSYAVIACWSAGRPELHDAALAAMQGIGTALRGHLLRLAAATDGRTVAVPTDGVAAHVV